MVVWVYLICFSMFYVGRFLLNAPTYNSVVYNLYFTATNLKVHVFILGVCIWQKHAHTYVITGALRAPLPCTNGMLVEYY